MTLTLNKEALLAIDEYTANEITLISISVILQRVRQEVVDINNTDIGVILILLNVAILPNNMVGIKLKDIGMHLEQQDIACNLQLSLELTTITILYTHSSIELTIELIIDLRCHLK